MGGGLQDGCVRIDATGEVVGPSTSGTEFMALSFVRQAGYREGAVTGTARLGVHRLWGQAFHVAFRFERGVLRAVHLSFCFDDPAAEKAWDHGVEMTRKRAHEDWCAERLGAPLETVAGTEGGNPAEAMRARAFPWGLVRSVYVGKGGAASLQLVYGPGT